MASISLQQLKIVEDQLRQIQEAIHNLELWNEPLTDVNELLSSPGGMKTLAADCMIIEAIGEGIKRIDERAPINYCFHHGQKYLGKRLKVCAII